VTASRLASQTSTRSRSGSDAASAPGVRRAATARTSARRSSPAITTYIAIEKPVPHSVDQSPLLTCSAWRSLPSYVGPKMTPITVGTTGRP
jgi:hypothetical protein